MQSIYLDKISFKGIYQRRSVFEDFSLTLAPFANSRCFLLHWPVAFDRWRLILCRRIFTITVLITDIFFESIVTTYFILLLVIVRVCEMHVNYSSMSLYTMILFFSYNRARETLILQSHLRFAL